MDLKKIYDELFEILKIKDEKLISETLRSLIYSDELGRTINEYNKFSSQYDFEPLIKAYQFYCADREGNKQDFTPRCLSELVTKVTISQDDKIVMDMCAGLGALTIEINKYVGGKEFVLIELDDLEIPVLLFILCAHGINGYVINKNVFSEDYNAIYKVSNRKVTNELLIPAELPNAVVSNPPFNLTNNPKSNFLSNNTNYQFIYEAFSNSTDDARICFILPQSVLSSRLEQKSRKWLIDENLLEAVITMPDSMFDMTNVSTVVLLINKNKTHKKVTLIDHSKIFEFEILKKQGEGTNRVYSKVRNYLSTDHINNILQILSTGLDNEYSVTVDLDRIQDKQYNFSPSVYFDVKIEIPEGRPIEHILTDLNRVICHKNNVKLTMNETIAKSNGFDIIYNQMKESNESNEKINELLNSLNVTKISDNKFIQLTKTKNEIKFEQDKSQFSSFMSMNLPVWKHQLHFLNKEENRYLAELRDWLLPRLMNGEISVDSL